jgi:hypothetical protein
MLVNSNISTAKNVGFGLRPQDQKVQIAKIGKQYARQNTSWHSTKPEPFPEPNRDPSGALLIDDLTAKDLTTRQKPLEEIVRDDF